MAITHVIALRKISPCPTLALLQLFLQQFQWNSCIFTRVSVKYKLKLKYKLCILRSLSSSEIILFALHFPHTNILWLFNASTHFFGQEHKLEYKINIWLKSIFLIKFFHWKIMEINLKWRKISFNLVWNISPEFLKLIWTVTTHMAKSHL